MEDQKTQDPSLNVQLFVGNAIEHLKDLHVMGQEYYEKRLQLAVDASRREREAETCRINSLRAVDVEAVKVANQAAVKQAEALANQMAENAETLRASMAKTAEVLAAQLQAVTQSLDNRLKIVEEKQYLLAGSSKGRGDMWGWILSAVLALITVYSFLSK